MKIGVFDSGIGGRAVAEELRRLLPNATIICADDHEHVPYGGRSASEITRLTKAAVAPLIEERCDAIVIACNTATTAAIESLRNDFPYQTFVGLEPMVKPAAELTRTKIIAVLATPATLQSTRYRQLKERYGGHTTIIEPDCSDWATLIEKGHIDQVPVESVIHDVIQKNADVIVLGCTHYHWLKEKIQAIAGPNVTILEPSNAIKNRIDFLLNDSVPRQQR